MFEKEAEEYENEKCKDCYMCSYSEYKDPYRVCQRRKDRKQAYKDGAEFGYNKANEEFKICEQNADTYYDKLQKAKQIIQEFLELNYSEFIKTNAVFLHADKFLKE